MQTRSTQSNNVVFHPFNSILQSIRVSLRYLTIVIFIIVAVSCPVCHNELCSKDLSAHVLLELDALNSETQA